jgi:hypothetical protein
MRASFSLGDEARSIRSFHLNTDATSVRNRHLECISSVALRRTEGPSGMGTSELLHWDSPVLLYVPIQVYAQQFPGTYRRQTASGQLGAFHNSILFMSVFSQVM